MDPIAKVKRMMNAIGKSGTSLFSRNRIIVFCKKKIPGTKNINPTTSETTAGNRNASLFLISTGFSSIYISFVHPTGMALICRFWAGLKPCWNHHF